MGKKKTCYETFFKSAARILRNASFWEILLNRQSLNGRTNNCESWTKRPKGAALVSPPLTQLSQGTPFVLLNGLHDPVNLVLGAISVDEPT